MVRTFTMVGAVLISTVALATGASTRAQHAPGPVGVLIGLQEAPRDWHPPDPPSIGRLRTLWLNGSSPEQPAAPTELSHLLVPRRSGFWRVGLLEGCAETDYLDAEDNPLGAAMSLFAFLWAGPVGTQPEARADSRDLLFYWPTFRVGSCARRDVYCANEFTTRIEWVWPEFISIDASGTGSCGAHPDRTIDYSVRSLTARDRLAVREALGPSAETLFVQHFEAARREDQELREGDCGEYRDVAFDAHSWYIVRKDGTWKAEGWRDTHRLCGYGFDYLVDTDLSRITGRRFDDPSLWETFKARWAEIEDVHSSPGRQWTLIATSRELMILSDRSSEVPILRVPKSESERLVMVEWATGGNVARWNDEVVRFRASKEPPPRLVLP